MGEQSPKISSSPSSRLSQPGNKMYTITNKELLAKASKVAAAPSGVVAVPFRMRRVLERAISARRHCAEWFAMTSNNDDLREEDGHLHFIAVLEQAFSILEHVLPSSPKKGSNRPYRPLSSMELDNSPEEKPISDSVNTFAALTVEDADPLDITTTNSDIESFSSDKNISNNVTYELETDSRSDLLFAIFCLFQELRLIRNHLKEVWERHIEQINDLMTAATVTNAAIQFVSGLEQMTYQKYSQEFSDCGCYECILGLVVPEAFQGQKHSEAIRKCVNAVARSPDENWFASIAATLIKYRDNLPKGPLKKNSPLLPVPALIASDQPEIGTRVPSNEIRAEKEDELLTKLLFEMVLWNNMLEDRSSAKPNDSIPSILLVGDELTTIMSPLWKQRKVPLSAVFGARVLLDIHELFGKAVHLMADTMRLDTKVALNSLRLGDPEVMPEDIRLIASDGVSLAILDDLETKFDCGIPTRDDVLHSYKCSILKAVKPAASAYKIIAERKMQEKIGEGDGGPKKLKFIEMDPDTRFGWNHNPLLCGTRLMDLTVDLETCGAGVGSSTGTPLAAAYLYHTLQQLKCCPTPWPEMEKLIGFQVRPLFAGELPMTIDAILSRLRLRLSAFDNSPSRTKNGRKQDKRLDKKCRVHLRPSMISNCFFEFFRGNQSFPETFGRLNEGLKGFHRYISRPTLTSEQRKAPQETALTDTLEALERYMIRGVEFMKIDYILITRLSDELIQYVWAHFQRKGYTRTGKLEITQAPFFVEDLLDLVKQREDDNRTRLRRGEPLDNRQPLKEAAKAFEEFWGFKLYTPKLKVNKERAERIHLRRRASMDLLPMHIPL